MADEAPGIQNKGMLIVAVVLGLLAVLIYNWQIQRVRAESRGEMVKLLRFERDKKPGDEIDAAKDLIVQEVSKKLAAGLGDVAIVERGETPKKYDRFPVNQRVLKGQFLLNSYLTYEASRSPSARISDDNLVAMAVPLREAPGDILRPGDRVNLVAQVSLGGQPTKPERIIEDIKVLAVGGKSLRENSFSDNPYAREEGIAMYRAITVEVSPEASLQLETVLANTSGGMRVEVLSPKARPSPRAGKVNEMVLQRLGPAPSRRTGESPLD
ncbi:MAG TPA: hypothetical protein VNA25_28285 [Phycisphaerae bacterium]|nr:hypothetical protein [Phycisphaerae bacterium]